MKLRTHTMTCVKGRRGAMAFAISRDTRGTLNRSGVSFYEVRDTPEKARAALVQLLKMFHVPFDVAWREYTDNTVDFYSKSDKELANWAGAPPERQQWQKPWRTSFAGRTNSQPRQFGAKRSTSSEQRLDEVEVPIY